VDKLGDCDKPTATGWGASGARRLVEIVRREVARGDLPTDVVPRDDCFYYLHAIVLERFVARSRMFRWLGDTESGSEVCLRVLRRETWRSASESGGLSESVLGVAFASREAQRLWERAGQPSMLPPHELTATVPSGREWWVSALGVDATELVRVAASPAQLYDCLLASGSIDVGVLLGRVRESLAGPLSADMRRALVAALVLAPEIVEQRGADVAGREGTVVAATADGIVTEVVIEPHTCTLLGSTIHSEGPSDIGFDVPDSGVLRATAYVERGPRDACGSSD
jgi:hypothetical protein